MDNHTISHLKHRKRGIICSEHGLGIRCMPLITIIYPLPLSPGFFPSPSLFHYAMLRQSSTNPGWLYVIIKSNDLSEKEPEISDRTQKFFATTEVILTDIIMNTGSKMFLHYPVPV